MPCRSKSTPDKCYISPEALAEELLETRDLPIGALCLLDIVWSSPLVQDGIVPLNDVAMMLAAGGKSVYPTRERIEELRRCRV